MGKKLVETGRKVCVARPVWDTLSVEELRERGLVPLTASGDIDWNAVVGKANCEKLGVIAAMYDVDMRTAIKIAITEVYNLAMQGLMVGDE